MRAVLASRELVAPTSSEAAATSASSTPTPWHAGVTTPQSDAGWRRPSAAREEPVEHPYAELEALHRDALVDAVEQRHEVEVRRKQQRREPEAAHAERGEGLGVRATAH